MRFEADPDAANVVAGLAKAQVDQVEDLASRVADAVAVRRIGASFDVTSGCPTSELTAPTKPGSPGAAAM